MRTGAGWSAAPGEVVGTLLRRGLVPPIVPLAAPQAAEASEVPATPASSSRPRRRATTATSPRAGAAPGAGRARQAVTDLIWMGLALVLDGPLLMMASFAGARVVSVPLGSIPCEESKTRPVGACKVPVILFC